MNKCVTLLVLITFALTRLAHSQNVDEATFRDYAELYRESALGDSIKLLLDAIKQPGPEGQLLNNSWMFISGGDKGIVTPCMEVVDGELVKLPHQILKPNTALWYQQQFLIPSSGAFWIQADDGAQLFVNGELVKDRKGEWFFPRMTGNVTLTIRVLNNAMAGGLRSVLFVTKEQFAVHERNKALVERKQKLLTKLYLRNRKERGEVMEILKAVTGSSESALADAEKKLASTPLIIGPILSRDSLDRTILSCFPEGEHTVTLEYGYQKDQLTQSQEQEGPVARFILPNQSVPLYYRLRTGDTITRIYTLSPKAKRSNEFQFNVWADSQSGWEAFAKNITNISKGEDQFGIAAGDLVSDGFDEDHWRTFAGILSCSASTIPYYLVPGNHDYDGYYNSLSASLYHTYTGNKKPYFAWKHQNAIFVALDPNVNFPVGIHQSTVQYMWFMQLISSKAWQEAQWHFVILHQPPVSQGWEGYHGEQSIDSLLTPLIESAKIDFIIAGHTHDYERLTKRFGNQSVTYIVTGGGGGSLEPPESSSVPVMDKLLKVHHFTRFNVSGRTVKISVFDTNHKLIDSLTIQK